LNQGRSVGDACGRISQYLGESRVAGGKLGAATREGRREYVAVGVNDHIDTRGTAGR
jgi:hypothetical protein